MSLRTPILTTSPEISAEAVVDRSRAVRPKIAASFIRTSSNKSRISPLSAPLAGREGGAAAERREGEVGGAAPRNTGPPPPCIWILASDSGQSDAARGPVATGPRARRAAPAPPQATTAGALWDRRPQCHARPNSRSIVDRMDKAGYRDEPYLWSRCQQRDARGPARPRRAGRALRAQCRRSCRAGGVLQATPGRLCRDGGDRWVREVAVMRAV